ncbi:MAG: M28 family peptidase [Pseudomonadota bacterium]
MPRTAAVARPAALLLTLGVALAATLSTTACKREAEAPAAPAAPAKPGFPFKPAIDPADFGERVRMLASDEFEGRAPGTPGEDKTVEYLRDQFARMGLKPGNKGDWFQTVPMMETTADETTTMTIDVAGKPRTLAFGTDMVIGTRTGRQEVKIDASDLVFVGYGVDAPERQWNDYAGVDVKGKTVVMFVNDPGFHSKDPALFDGKRMTYYGRWTYKFEEAARKGAAAALIIHDTEGASYGWDVVKNSWSGAQYDLRAADDPAPRVPLQGWITGEQARSLFADAGLDLDALRAAAGKPGFKPMTLPAKMSTTLKSTIAEKESRNVVALLPGSERPDEAIVYMAHWDHLGKHPDETGDNIYNGAVDNATGVAGILEIAEAMAGGARPKRSMLFVAVTLEESGLLGSKYYVAHPSVPLDRTVGVINIDAMSVAGRARDLVVVGMGNSEMEDILKPIAERQQRTLVEESNPAGGYYFRSDHFNFAKAGVPALYADGGNDLLEGGAAAGDAAGKDYNERRYHKPDDEYDPATWKLDGTMQDLAALFEVGLALGFGDQWPNWYAGNPFRAAREKMMADNPPPAAAGPAGAASQPAK